MAGIYIHIPFCKKACIYCDFHFSTNLGKVDEMSGTIVKEMLLRKENWQHLSYNTIYFGGGTPSVLNINQLNSILNAIHENFNISPEAEITLEANPDDLSQQKLNELKAAGVNRLSIGIQTFHEEHLKWMNRSHNAEQAIKCLEVARVAGFKNISTDLIYGFTGLEMETLKADIEKLIAAGATHISAYAMTVEPKTVLGFQQQKDMYTEPPDENTETAYRLICQMLKNAGFEHYEVSNWAKPGFRSKHNSNYWKGTPYLGLGPAAHSFLNGIRSWNKRNNAHYLKAVNAGIQPSELERLSNVELINEYLMTSLRTAAGIDMNLLREKQLPYSWYQYFEKLHDEGYLVKRNESYYRIPEEKWLMSDFVIAFLFLDS